MKWPEKSPPKSQQRIGHLTPFKTILTPLLFIMTTAIILSSWGNYFIHRKALKDSMYAQSEMQAHNSRDAVQGFLKNELNDLLNHGRNLVGRFNIRSRLFALLTHPEDEKSASSLEELFQRNDYDYGLANIYLLDSQRQVLFRHGQTVDFSDRDDDILAALAGQETSSLISSRGLWHLRVCVPIKRDRQTDGILVLSLELDLVLDRIAEEMKLGLKLMNREEAQRFSSNLDAPLKIKTRELLESLNDGGMFSYLNKKRNKLIHLMPLKLAGGDYILASEIGLGNTQQLLQQKSAEVLQLTLLLLVILLPSCALFFRIMLRPLSVLRDRAVHISKELGGQESEQRGHEIRRLVDAFDGMAGAISEHEAARIKAEAQLQQEHATLEVKVKERTRDLEKTNELLQREILDRTRTQKKAEDLQRFLASLIDSMPSAIIGVDIQHRIMRWNLEAQKLFGLSLEQVRGQDIFSTLPQLSEINDRIIQTIDRGLPNKVRKLNWSTGQGSRLIDVVIFPFIKEQLGGAVIRLDDVTERTRVDELMMQSEKMMSVGGLAAGMAHEINNPLASIVQGSQVISQRLSPDLTKNRVCAEEIGINLEDINRYLEHRQVKKMLASIHESGLRAGEIVNNMLSFTRQNETVKSLQNIAHLLDRSVDLATKDYDLKKEYDFHQIRIERDYAPNLPEIVCSPSQIQQVFFNLLQNAAQALASKRSDTPHSIRLSIQKTAESLLVEISDNGPGIPLENQKRIFEPFFTTKDVGQGTGLGLSVSYFIITENHGGRIDLESSPDAGTRFRILLPLGGPHEEQRSDNLEAGE